ncbi:hypothetical protein DEJ50_03545 [Streptomyces venezuelae]|uniref:UspA domain-containing protein n=1 Tax=Streptomyces venezuelae TaxID=54571 RepID=A0A5P2CXS3_STRVZ|nr:hypothetical protein [Streptomyces venezuelae]QES47060.1 hypothetical protein DEJ50_03545 [Streptomyces venezuelae]
MSNRITVGQDGSGADLACADWAAEEAELRGGSRRIDGFFVGSTGSDAIPRTKTPVVLVRATENRGDASAGRAKPYGPVVRGVDLRCNCDRLFAFSCEEAHRRSRPFVVGRRVRRSALGAHIGPLTHAVMHHATSPVAVVAHD